MKYIKPHLSPELRAQITPSTRKDMKLTVAGVFFLLASLGLTVNLFSGEKASLASNDTRLSDRTQSQISPLSEEKQVLGESTQAVVESKEPSFTEYTVKPGDTLFNISQQYNIRWDLIAEINSLSEPYLLHGGQKLKIPQTTTSLVPGKIYTVRSNDTLVSIASQYNITVNDIIAVNPNLQQSDLITVGQVIKLP